MTILSARARKTYEMRPIFRAPTFCVVKSKKPLDLKIFSQIEKIVKMLSVNSKCYHEHQPTCNILIMFTYLMVPKLLYLLRNWETFS